MAKKLIIPITSYKFIILQKFLEYTKTDKHLNMFIHTFIRLVHCDLLEHEP